MAKVIITYDEEPETWLIWIENDKGRREVIFRTKSPVNFREVVKIQEIIKEGNND